VDAAEGQVDILLWMDNLHFTELPRGNSATMFVIKGMLEHAIWELGDSLIEKRDLGPMMDLITESRDTEGFESVLSICFAILRGRVEADDPIVNEHIEFVAPLSLQAIKGSSYKNAIDASSLLIEIINNRPYFLVNKGMVKMLVDGLTDSFAGEVWFHSLPAVQEDNSKKLNVFDQAVICIDCMGQQVPVKSLMAAVMSKFHECIHDSDHLIRKAGFVLLGTITEGCTDAISSTMSTLLPQVLEAVNDPSFNVREAAMYVLTEMAAHCIPTVLRYHGDIVTAAIKGLKDTEPSVQVIASKLVENHLEQLHPSIIVRYFPLLMPILFSLMRSPVLEVKLAALRTVGPIASVSGSLFEPYINETVATLTPNFEELSADKIRIDEDSSDEESYNEFHLSGLSIECLGHLASSGSDAFIPHLQFAMTSVIRIIQTQIENDGTALEYAFVSVANIARDMGTHSDFIAYIETIFPYLQRTALESFRDGNQIAALKAIGALANYMLGSFF